MNKKVLVNLCLTAGSRTHSVPVVSVPDLRGMSWGTSMAPGQAVPSPPLHRSKARDIIGTTSPRGPRKDDRGAWSQTGISGKN